MTISPHPDDERLSAHLDGEGDDETAAHLASCRECEAKVAGLRLVSAQVGTSVAGPPDGVREAAIRAAGTAWSAALHDRGVSGGKAEVVALERRRRRLPRWALPVAAAAAALLVAVPVVGSLGGGGRGHDATSTTGDREAAAGTDAKATGIDGGDLGEVSDAAALALAISPALPGAASEAALTAPAPPAGGTGGPEADAQAPTSMPAPAPASAKTFSQRELGTTKAARLGERPCAGTARTSYGQGLGPLVYTALVRWQERPGVVTPAVVLAYRVAEPGAPGLDYRVLVMALGDCRLLVAPTL